MANSSSLRAPVQMSNALKSSSMVRKVQSVCQSVFRRSSTSFTPPSSPVATTSSPGASSCFPNSLNSCNFSYNLLNSNPLECVLSLAVDEFRVAVSSSVPEKPIAIERSELQWEQLVPEALKAALVAGPGGEAAKRRQNALHELLLREMNLCHDLLLSVYLFERPLVELGLLTAGQAALLFGAPFQALFEVHFALVKRLMAFRGGDGLYSEGAGPAEAVLEEITTGRLTGPYEAYLGRLKEAQKLLKSKVGGGGKCRRFAAFLAHPIIEAATRKLGLATFIDAPRSLLMKLGLLFAEIAKVAASEEEAVTWGAAIEAINGQIGRLNQATAFAEYRKTVATFWLGGGGGGVGGEAVSDQQEDDDKENGGTCSPEMATAFKGSTELVLRSRVRRKSSRFNRGKPTLMLFNKVLILARQSSLRFNRRYHIVASVATGSVLFFDYGSSKAISLGFGDHLSLKAGGGVGGNSGGVGTFRRFQRRLKVGGAFQQQQQQQTISTTSLSRRLKKHQIQMQQQQQTKTSISRSPSTVSTSGGKISNKSSPTVSASGSRRSSATVAALSMANLKEGKEIKTLHLFSLDVQASFNVALKFASAHEVKLWKGKLATYFTLLPNVPSSGLAMGMAINGSNNNNSASKLIKSNSQRSLSSVSASLSSSINNLNNTIA